MRHIHTTYEKDDTRLPGASPRCLATSRWVWADTQVYNIPARAECRIRVQMRLNKKEREIRNKERMTEEAKGEKNE